MGNANRGLRGRGKAPEDWRSPSRWRVSRGDYLRASVLECGLSACPAQAGSPLSLSGLERREPVPIPRQQSQSFRDRAAAARCAQARNRDKSCLPAYASSLHPCA